MRRPAGEESIAGQSCALHAWGPAVCSGACQHQASTPHACMQARCVRSSRVPPATAAQRDITSRRAPGAASRCALRQAGSRGGRQIRAQAAAPTRQLAPCRPNMGLFVALHTQGPPLVLAPARCAVLRAGWRAVCGLPGPCGRPATSQLAHVDSRAPTFLNLSRNGFFVRTERQYVKVRCIDQWVVWRLRLVAGCTSTEGATSWDAQLANKQCLGQKCAGIQWANAALPPFQLTLR